MRRGRGAHSAALLPCQARGRCSTRAPGGGAAAHLRHASGAARRPADARARAAQCSVYIAFDPALREGAGGEPARARNSDIVEDLGLVEYVFSDKTGTLTSNEMQLRAVAVKDAAFGGLDTKCGLWLDCAQTVGPSSRPHARSEAGASAARGREVVDHQKCVASMTTKSKMCFVAG